MSEGGNHHPSPEPEENEPCITKSTSSETAAPSSPEPEQPTMEQAISIRRSTYKSDVENEDNVTPHGVFHAIDIDSTPKQQTLHDTFLFTPYSSRENWTKANPELRFFADIKRKGEGSKSAIKLLLTASTMFAAAAAVVAAMVATMVGDHIGYYKYGKVPDDRETWTWGRFRQEYECEKYYIHQENKRFYTMADWQTMRDIYIQHVDSSYVFDDPIPPTKGYSLQGKGNPPPFYAALSPGSGRGLFASRDIHEGELVHNGTISDVSFPNADAFRRFMFALPTKEMACDVTEWTWTQPLHKNGPLKLMTSFTISILVNEADDEEEMNILPESEVSSLFYATRDIQKGEEITTSYDTLYSADFDEVGLGW
eukprot:scaffold67_cov155-Skeletonema_menzelii.AAC.14